MGDARQAAAGRRRPAEMYQLGRRGQGRDPLATTSPRCRTCTAATSIELRDADRRPSRLPIVGIVVDWSDQQGTILMDRAVYIAVLERRHA